MKNYLKMLWKNHKEEIITKSYKNCHVKGLHSIMFNDGKEKTIRLYYLEPDSEISNLNVVDIQTKTPLAFHPHHCELGLEVVKGSLINWTTKEVYRAETESFNNFPLKRYLYQSHITKGSTRFILDDPEAFLKTVDIKRHSANTRTSFVRMDAKEIHTVFTEEQEDSVAWLVFEGKEDENYDSICYSSLPLDAIPKRKDFYLPITEQEINEILNDIWRI